MYRMVDCGTWDDPWFAELEPAAKLLFLYLITNHRSTPAGCFEITERAICFETGITPDRIKALIPAFGDRVRWWPDERVIWVKNFYRRQSGEKANPKFREGARRALAQMPAVVRETVSMEYPELRVAGDAPSPKSEGHTSPIEGVSPVIVIETEVVTEPEEIVTTSHGDVAPSEDRTDGDVYALVDAYAEGKGLKRTELAGAPRQKAFRSLSNAPNWATAADIKQCTKYLMTDPFWQKPGKLQAQSVVEILPDWRKDGKPVALGRTTANGRASPPNGRAGQAAAAIDTFLSISRGER